ncbi:SH3 domain protein [Pseudohyphozyma bogoriensis]|nr:SH3 domain protein [Pseudohyphozyma bogoriensis]
MSSATTSSPSPSSPGQAAPPAQGPPPDAALFPSPSSSFRPPPPEESSILDRLDERIAAHHADNKAHHDPGQPADDQDRQSAPSSDDAPSSSAAPPTHSQPSTSNPASNPSGSTEPDAGAAARDGDPAARGGDGDAAAARDATWDLPLAALSLSDSVLPQVVVRDFAFKRDDPRFKGEPDPQEAEREREREEREREEEEQLSEANEDKPGNDAFASSGSSAYSWGFVTSHNADFVSEAEDDSQIYSEDDDRDIVGDFVAGLYTALYDFERELESEMSIRTGETVNVISRQCDGWVLAARIHDGRPTSEQGLIPENYLNFVGYSPHSGDDQRDGDDGTADGDWSEGPGEGEGEGDAEADYEESLGGDDDDDERSLGGGEDVATPRPHYGDDDEEDERTRADRDRTPSAEREELVGDLKPPSVVDKDGSTTPTGEDFQRVPEGSAPIVESPAQLSEASS